MGKIYSWSYYCLMKYRKCKYVTGLWQQCSTSLGSHQQVCWLTSLRAKTNFSALSWPSFVFLSANHLYEKRVINDYIIIKWYLAVIWQILRNFILYKLSDTLLQFSMMKKKTTGGPVWGNPFFSSRVLREVWWFFSWEEFVGEFCFT